MLVCSLGDLLLDVVVRLDGALVPGGDVAAETRVAPGGQAANVAGWVAFLGGDARFLGKRADDEGGRLATAALTRLGVELAGPIVDEGTGVVVSLVAADGERTMASSRGIGADLRTEEIDDEWLACDHLHVSGYALAGEPMRTAAEHAVLRARGRGARVSIDLAATSVIDAVGPAALRGLLERLEPDVVFCNEAEGHAFGTWLGGTTWIVKRGARGVSVDGVDHDAAPAERVVDSTGAGDAFAAGWILGGLPVALDAAARCVAQVGALPA